MTFQAHDLKYVSIPIGWDASYLENFRLADGISFAEVVSDIEMALGAFNSESPWYADVITVTDEPAVEYPQGDLTTEAHSEYTPPKPQRTDFTGHMLPVIERDLGFRFTRDFFVKGRMSRVDASIRAGIDAFRQRREYEAFSAAFVAGKAGGDGAMVGQVFDADTGETIRRLGAVVNHLPG